MIREGELLLSKRLSTMNGTDFYQMVLGGAENLKANVERVNALNVFPVPDGDTGTNMNLTMTSGVEELKKSQTAHLGKAAQALAKGLLMGARGNSGVILSQLFRGFAKHVQEMETIGIADFAAALQSGVDTAYKAVVKPVEGTVLTVSREAAKHAMNVARRVKDLPELLTEVLQAGNQSLARTPELLPILKQVGVVDAGGQGLLYIYEGFLRALQGELPSTEGVANAAALSGTADLETLKAAVHAAETGHKSAQAQLRTEDIEFGYCTEFIVKLVPGKTEGYVFSEDRFRRDLSQHGDSLLVVADDSIVKVHIHAEYPGNVLNYAMNYGDLTRIKIENMREQHTHILEETGTALPSDEPNLAAMAGSAGGEQRAPYGFVAGAMGEGIAEIFHSLGVNGVISGGQTMNPSTEDIVNAVSVVDADTVFVLPNNSNIVMAAQQAVELVTDKEVRVIPTKSIPQGLAAMLAFDDQLEPGENEQAMAEAALGIQSGQVTYAVRDSSIDGIDIKEGDFIGIHNNKIVSANRDLLSACRSLLDHMMASGGEIVMILTGEDAKQEETDELAAYVKEQYPDAELEIHYGGQPLYHYLISVE